MSTRKQNVRVAASFLVGIFMSLCAGTLYGVGAYSSNLKIAMGYTGAQYGTVNSIGLLGQYVGILPGVLCKKVGFQWTAAYAGLLCFLGYFGMYIQIKTQFSKSCYLLGFFLFLAGQGSISLYLTCLCNVQNFKSQRRGSVIGILASGFGLSGFVFTSIFHIFFAKQESEQGLLNYLLLLALVCGTSGFLGALCLFVIPVRSEESEPLLEGEENSVHVKEPIQIINTVVDVPLGQTLKSVDFALPCLIFFFGISCGLVFIENIGLNGASLGFSKSYVLVLVQVLSITNCTGRLAAGVISDTLSVYFSLSFFISCFSFTLLIAHVLLVFFQKHVLLVATILNGLSYGALFSLIPIYLTEKFGPKNIGLNLGLSAAFIALGNTPLNTLVGHLYDHYTPSTDIKCVGVNCFKYGWIMTSVSLSIALSFCLVLLVRTKRDNGNLHIFC